MKEKFLIRRTEEIKVRIQGTCLMGEGTCRGAFPVSNLRSSIGQP
jgi:hypothetical protein